MIIFKKIYSAHWGWALPVGGVAPRTFANPGAATVANHRLADANTDSAESVILIRPNLECQEED